jgi:beta-glucosidase
VKNTGLHGGDEVAELYLIPTHTNVSPSLALQGFKRLHIAPGASEHVVFRLDPRLLSQVDSQGNRDVPPGTYRIFLKCPATVRRFRK